MVKTASTMVSLETEAPHFSLPDVISGKIIAVNSNFHGKALVIMFICNHCPYVKHILQDLVKLANEYLKKSVEFIAINANDVEHYPDDSPINMQKIAKKFNFPFPYLFDSTQEVAKAYQAACTPDFFVFDNKKLLRYRGQLDDSRPGNSIPVTGKSIRDALDQLLSGNSVSTIQKPSLGCNIKWKQ